MQPFAAVSQPVVIELRYLGRPIYYAPFAWIAANGNLAIFLRTAAAAARQPTTLALPAAVVMQSPSRFRTGATAVVASHHLVQQPNVTVRINQVRNLALSGLSIRCTLLTMLYSRYDCKSTWLIVGIALHILSCWMMLERVQQNLAQLCSSMYSLCQSQ